jgi:hypothetical protein
VISSTLSYRKLQRIVAEYDAVAFDPSERIRQGSLYSILKEILFHAEWRFWQFTPTHTGAHHFGDRLLAWLQNVEPRGIAFDALLRTVPHIQFVDRDDMLTLYRSAFQGPIRRWLMDELNLDFSRGEEQLSAALQQGVAKTWFCPITDSMDIAQFHHVNGIAGDDYRPSWRTLARFGEFSRIRKYMEDHNLERLTLLEDFVGSGRQTTRPLEYAITELCPTTPTLVVPLIISEIGLTALREKVRGVKGFQIEPIFVVPLQTHVAAAKVQGEPEFVRALRTVVESSFPRVREPLAPETEPLREAFGFGSVGTLLVLYSNCPNNTLPLIWHQAPNWKALFPRISRY